MTGFFPRERGGGWSWRWMGPQGAWTVVNTTSRPVVASVGLQLSAFNHRRRLDVLLDGQHRHTLVVEPPRRTYEVGPLTIVPGVHELVFRPVDPTTPATDSLDNGDPRRLSFALGTWTWTVRGEEP